MRVEAEIDFEDALDAYIDDIYGYYGTEKDKDIQEYCGRLLNTVPTYERMAQILVELLDENPSLDEAFKKLNVGDEE